MPDRSTIIRIVQYVSHQLWKQLPLGTELTWTFFFRQLRQNWGIILKSTKLLVSAFLRLFNVWTVVAIPWAANMHRDVIYRPAPFDPVAKVTYYLIAFPLAYIFVIAGGIVLAIITAVAGTILGAVVIAVIGSWTLAVLLLFVLWLGLYRLPVYEIFYPRVRNWILDHNSDIYSDLAATPTIRVIRLRPGKEGDQIECDLISEPLAEANFEALSYVWGSALIPCKIQVNDRPFYVTRNLHSALYGLRHNSTSKMLWVDAICINQKDTSEKNVQVKMMRDIYAKATKVVVWLGECEKNTESALELVRQFGDVNLDAGKTWWKDLVGSSRWEKHWRTYRSIIEREWWTRTWIIQEVVLGKDIVVQLGSHKINWDLISRFISCRPFIDCFRDFDTPYFAKDIQELRSGIRSDEAISNTLFGLTYRFRWQSASLGSDKIYALLGLLKPENLTLLVPDYAQSPEDVFLQLTLSSLEHNKSLTAVALATGAEIQGMSWCRDWRFKNDGRFNAMHLCTHPPPDGPEYSASGTHIPVYEADLVRRVLSLQGYTVDVVARSGEIYQDAILPADWRFALQSWEHIAGGPWHSDSPFKQAFNRTITGNSCSVEPFDQESPIRHCGKPVHIQEDQSYLYLIDQVCQNRRFFITETGRFGLGPWNLRKGDMICVLLGGKTLFVLRPCAPPDHATKTEYHKVVGEALVDGLMYYQGSMENDIEEGKVVPRWYYLR